jgi:hypothetical protein
MIEKIVVHPMFLEIKDRDGIRAHAQKRAVEESAANL